MIDREDMLELTRRMNLKRNCFGRIAGAYIAEEGWIDGTFNTYFSNLSPQEQASKLAIAKAIPFAESNVHLKEYTFSKEKERPDTMWGLLMGIRECELKNDALLETLYEKITEIYSPDAPYALMIYHGTYDVPLKASDKENLWESEEVYSFLIGAVCPLTGDYEPGEPTCGFLFPAFRSRSCDVHRINFFQSDDSGNGREILDSILMG